MIKEISSRLEKEKIKNKHSNIIECYKPFLKNEFKLIKKKHNLSKNSIFVSGYLSDAIDVLIVDIFNYFINKHGISKNTKSAIPIALMANGGYGRKILNPGSDIDLQFIVRSNNLDKNIKEVINDFSLTFFDLGLQVSYPVRTIKEACDLAAKDNNTKTTFLDSRFIAGNVDLFNKFKESFYINCIKNKEKVYFEERKLDIQLRHKKHKNTIHLQEPNVKEGCGGLRDYQNLIWIIKVLDNYSGIKDLVSLNKLTNEAYLEIKEAFKFLLRVRNSLHYSQKGIMGDILTLRLQGVVALDLKYKGKNVLHKIEYFMRDYYRHTRSLYNYSTSIIQEFEIDFENKKNKSSLSSIFFNKEIIPEDVFDGFYVIKGIIYPKDKNIFFKDPHRMMRFFLHVQQRNLKTSPEIRRVIELNLHLVDKSFRINKAIRDTFEEILQTRGKVARVFRIMHRIGFLGAYIPEFRSLTDLVQHEFFHRYSADEHTLRCIEILDGIIYSNNPSLQFFKEIFHEMEDPVAMYISLLMHDTGRAKKMKKHEDASAILSSRVCKRLNYKGDRLRLIMFLVDHHLTFWRVSTTKDVSDINTVLDFCHTVKSPKWMRALYLFTYVDSNGTNDEAWNDWKASLMNQLYRYADIYFKDKPYFEENFYRPLKDIKGDVMKKFPKSYTDEINAHFENMPDRYFGHRGVSSVSRHIEQFHNFFLSVDYSFIDSLIPKINWKHRPNEGYSLFEVTGWNRKLLLPKVAGAIASRDINILSADLFRRKDDLILYIFKVRPSNLNASISNLDMKQIQKLITDEFNLTECEINFEALIEEKESSSIVINNLTEGLTIPHKIDLFNEEESDSTVLQIQVEDRIGLLYSIFNVLSDLNLQILNARISTQAQAAIDRFHIIDGKTNKKIENKKFLDEIKNLISKELELHNI